MKRLLSTGMGKATFVLVVLAVLFGGYVGVSTILVHHKYDPYTEGMQEVYSGMYILTQEDYLNSVTYPSFLAFTGNLGVSTPDNAYSEVDPKPRTVV